MPLVIAPVLVGLVALLSVLVLIALQHATSSWLRPLMLAFTIAPRNFWLKVVAAPLHLIAKGITFVEHQVSHALGVATGAALKPLTGWLNGLALWFGETTLHIAGLAQATYDALNILRHTTVPGLIRAAVDPLRVIAVRADKAAAATAAQLASITADLGRALDTAGLGAWSTLHNQLIGMAHVLDSIQGKVFGDLAPKVERLIAQVYSTIAVQIAVMAHDVQVVIPGQIGALGGRVKTLEDAIGDLLGQVNTKLGDLLNPVTFAALVVAAITKFAPQLFCRNSLKAAEQVCALDGNLLDDLLTDVVLLAEGLSILEIVRLGQELAGPVMDELATLE